MVSPQGWSLAVTAVAYLFLQEVTVPDGSLATDLPEPAVRLEKGFRVN